MKEIEKIKALPKGKRWEYIWDYYWYYIVGILAVIVVSTIMIRSSRMYQEPILDVIMVNTYKTSEEQEQVVTQILEEQGIETFDGAVSVDTNIRFGVDDASNTASLNQLMCTTADGEGDVYLWYGEEFNMFIGQGALADLRDYLSQEMLNQVEDKLIYAEREGESYPCGIDLKDNAWAIAHGYKIGGFAGICRQVKNTETAKAFMEYLIAAY